MPRSSNSEACAIPEGTVKTDPHGERCFGGCADLASFTRMTGQQFQAVFKVIVARHRFRIRRFFRSLFSRSRFFATLIGLISMSAYLLLGVAFLGNRESADPQNLFRWLSGGMALYLMYHSLRCVYQSVEESELEDPLLSKSEQHYLAGAPLNEWAMTAYLLMDRVSTASVKTLLLLIALWVDSSSPLAMGLGILTAMVLVDWLRDLILMGFRSLNRRYRLLATVGTTVCVVALVLQVLGRAGVDLWSRGMWSDASQGVHPIELFGCVTASLGEAASCGAIQGLAVLFYPSAWLAVSTTFVAWQPWCCLAFVLLVFAGLTRLQSVFLKNISKRNRLQELIELRRLRRNSENQNEKQQLAKIPPQENRAPSRQRWQHDPSTESTVPEKQKQLFHPNESAGLALFATIHRSENPPPRRYLILRAWKTAKTYRKQILGGFLLPLVYCWLPMLMPGLNHSHVFVIGGIVFCTMMVAPTTLRIDFRRDRKRFLLLKSLPMKTADLVQSQIYVPVVITCLFQLFALAPAVVVYKFGLWSTLIILSCLLPTAVIAISLENAIFLMYPAGDGQRGMSMLVRTKLMFLLKALLITLGTAAVASWMALCRCFFTGTTLPMTQIVGVFIGFSLLAYGATGLTAVCWRRFATSAPAS